MVVTVRAVLVATQPSKSVPDACANRDDLRIFHLLCIFSEAFFTLLARECHVEALRQGMLLALLMALCTIKPLAATRGADGDLGVEDMFAV